MYLLIGLELMWVGLLAGVVLESPVVGVLALLAAVILLRFSRPLRALFGLGMSGYWASVGYELAVEFQGVSLGVVMGAGAFAVATYLHRPMLVPLFDGLSRSEPAHSGRVSSESLERQSDARAAFGDWVRSWPEDPYAVLGIATDATDLEIRSAYHERMREYHPDRAATLGEEIRDLAEAKTKQISGAYELLTGRTWGTSR